MLKGLNLCLEIGRGVQHPVQGDGHTFCLFSVLSLAMDSKRPRALERRLGRGWAFDSGVSFSRVRALRDERASPALLIKICNQPIAPNS